MDHKRLDALARAVSTRRVALAGGFGSLAAWFGFAPEAAAHNALKSCRKLANPAQRRACQRRARAHNRKHRCKSRPPRRICAELRRCSGVAANDCGRLINCECSSGLACLNNGSCAQNCQRPGPTVCPENCFCFGPEAEGGNRCVPDTISCDQMPQVCTNTVDCPRGTFCLENACAGPTNRENRCAPLCASGPGST